MSKFIDLSAMITVSFIVKDPKSKERLLSMDTKADNYVGNLSTDIYNEILDKAVKILEPITANEIREVVNDPDFLYLSAFLKNVGSNP